VPKSSKGKHETRRANRDRRQRIEEMRKQQRAAERRKNFLFVGSAIVVAIILIAAAVIPAYLHDRSEKAKSKAGFQAKPTAAESKAGCLGVHNDPLSPAGQHTTAAINYAKTKYGDTRNGTPPIPPTGGQHNPVSLGDTNRFYPLSEEPRPERAVHDLEHGYIVIWYDAKLPASEVTKLQAMAKQPSLSRLLVVGWSQGDLPADKHVVLTAWGRTDRCETVSDAVVNAFYEKHLNSSLAPEAGVGPITGADACEPRKLDCGAGMSPSPVPSATATANS
jgi:hypothetical protein